MTTVVNPSLSDLLTGCVADPAQVRMGELDLFAMSHDASHFLLRPTAIVAPKTATEVANLLQATSRAGVRLTFRAGGTSLSGQSQGDAVLADVRRHFVGITVLDDGARVRVEPGVTVRRLNAYLAPYGRKFGPDPASEAACTIGGVVANNSSGMACGTVENSYRTLESVVAVLPSGTVVDTGEADADTRLRTLEPELYEGLIRLRDRVRSNPASVATVTRQFAMKNTMGYGLNSLLDYDTPVDILTHLLVGSEGTLGFVASATFRTIPIRSFVTSTLLVFDNLYDANSALPGLVETGAATLELMDATSLRVGQGFDDSPAAIQALQVDKQAALLVEYQATTAAELASVAAGAQATLASLPLREPVVLTDDPVVRGLLWKFRKGLYTSVAGARPAGSTALLEDVVVPVASLADTCVDLATLFTRFSYEDSVIFGHAKDGNIHFMLTDRFQSDEQLDRFASFTEEMVDVVLGHGGSLKAEHGTGRVMAPFVRRQYGDELYEVMVEIKRLFDPGNFLNPGVIITDDPLAHLRHIKVSPPVDDLVDRCVECGYCEPVCPSRNLTTTPRQRIALYRDITRAEAAGDDQTAERLRKAYRYAAVHTCAVDGMCGTACPVHINTGLLVKEFRKVQVPALAAGVWTVAAKHWAGMNVVASTALNVTDALPDVLEPPLIGVNQAARWALGSDSIPLWSRELPGGGHSRKRPAPAKTPDAVYIPACVNVMFGPTEGPGVQVAFEDLCARAGITLLVPEKVASLCCGTPWSSKGIPKGYEAMRSRVVPVIREATDNCRLPVVCDASSCTEGFRHILENELDVEVIDAVAFVAQKVLPVLGGTWNKIESVTVHPTCSSTQMGLNPDLVTVAKAAATTVNVPKDWGCCAFAGDRGMLHPELTRSATRFEATEVEALDAGAHASCNRTCELGLTRATGNEYRHILEILDEQVKAGA